MSFQDEEAYEEVDRETQKFTATVRENCGALLSRQWHIVLPLALTAYIILQSSVTYFSICTGEEPIEPWTQQVIVAIAGCFILSVVYHAVIGIAMGAHSSNSKQLSYPRSVYAAAAVVSLLAGISACIKINDNYHSICKDALGMETFSSQWPEWLVDVPLLGYITVALEDKYELEREDIVLICMMFCMIFFGFCATITKDRLTGCILLCISACCIMGNFYVAFKSSKRTQAKAIAAASKGRNGRSLAAASAQWAFERMMMKGRLSWLLIYVLPLFPITYLLGLSGIFDRDQVIASNMICSVFAKLIFVGILSLESLFVQLAQKNNDTRRKALNHAAIEGYSLMRGRTPLAHKTPYGTNPNPGYDSLNQVGSVEDEVNFNLLKIQNQNILGYKNATKSINTAGNQWPKSASDGPLNTTKSSHTTTEPGKGVSTGKLSINI